MGYIGPAPTSGFISNAKERYTGITTAYVDLNHSISSLADVIVWVNYVKQDATNLTLTSSTRITLGATLVSADIVEVAYLGKAVSTQAPATGSVTSDMLSGSIANSKLANSSITLNGSAVSLGGSATVGGENTPSFQAYNSSETSCSHNTYTKIAYTNAEWNLGSNYDTSTSRFTPTTAGKYYVYHIGGFNVGTDSEPMRVCIYKNGSLQIENQYKNFYYNIYYIACTVDMNGSSDYVEAYALQQTGGAIDFDNGKSYRSRFGAYRLIT